MIFGINGESCRSYIKRSKAAHPALSLVGGDSGIQYIFADMRLNIGTGMTIFQKAESERRRNGHKYYL